MKQFNYIISGGGTGGHIYPALAIANQIKAEDPTASIIFVGALGKMEMEKVPQAGYKIHGIWIAGIQRAKLWKNFFFPLKLMISLIHSFFIWLRYRPDVLIGTGGFASGPMLYVGGAMGSKTYLQEQNSYPGITNKLLAKRAAGIAVAYPGMERYFPKEKIHYTGNPVRESLLKISSLREQGLAHFNLDPTKKTLAVLGGSLGARAINDLIADHIELFDQLNLQLIWQCGKMYYEDYASFSSRSINVHSFIQEMDCLYAAADFIISRAGASTISELSIVAKPLILIPSPNVAENHQYKNAAVLAEKGAAILMPESSAKETFEATLKTIVLSEKKQLAMAESLAQMALPKATETIVQHIKKLIPSHAK